ncbi:MAG: Ig-like domain-containing protein [Chloroflexota bacterium]
MRPTGRRGIHRAFLLAVATSALLGSLVLPSATSAVVNVTGERVKVIVTFKARPGASASAAIQSAGGHVGRKFGIIPAVTADIPVASMTALRHNPLVRSVEADGRLTAFATGDLEYDNAWGVTHIGTKAVHDAGILGAGVKVAIIDTGLDYIHNQPPSNEPPVVDNEFNSNYRGGYDFVNNDNDPMDDNGHGTHVAGILAAEHNGYLVVGVAPAVDLYALKVLGASGEGDYSGLIAALDWAVQNHMDVVNMSLGGHEASAALAASIHAAYAAGITLVAASGNAITFQDLISGCPVAYPAAYPEVIAVSFTNTSDKLTGFSCTGPQVDLAAPGDQIPSTVPVGSCMFCSPSGYAFESGTSMASPHVAGVVALILSNGILNAGDPATLADDVKAHLCRTASPAGMALTDPRYASYYGCGIVDAEQALLIDPPPPPPGHNARPIAGEDMLTTVEDTAANVDVLSNDSDADGDTLTVATVAAAAHGTASINLDGTVHYVPAANFAGQDAFDYTVADGNGGSDTGRVSVVVTPVNDPPVAVNDTVSTTRDTAVTIDVLRNDTDPDGDTLATVAVGAPGVGTASILPDGSVRYTPPSGYSGPDSFDYTISDGHREEASATVSITVTGANHAPVATPDSATTAEDTTVTIPVLANDTDAEGGPLTTASVAQPGHGATSIAANGSVTYTPTANYFGPDAFSYVVADGAGATAEAAVTITVTPVNDPPVAGADTVTTPEDTAASVAVLTNDTDVDGDALTVTAVTKPGHGTATIGASGVITYTPAAEYSGADSFGYTLSDGHGGRAAGAVSITVTPVNDVPTATAKSASTTYQTALTIRLVGNDRETCELGWEIVTPPAHGSVAAPSAIACSQFFVPFQDQVNVKYTPADGFSGTDTFTFRTSDGSQWSAPATVSVAVGPPVLVHVGDLDGTKTVATSTWTAKVTIRIDDPAHGPINGATITGVWSNGATGTVTCRSTSAGTCTISKSSIPKSAQTVTFTVTNVDYPLGEYLPASNHDPDGDSNGTVIVVGP